MSLVEQVEATTVRFSDQIFETKVQEPEKNTYIHYKEISSNQLKTTVFYLNSRLHSSSTAVSAHFLPA